jgi:hypothetical protein
MISQRTKAALAALKVRGVRLGRAPGTKLTGAALDAARAASIAGNEANRLKWAKIRASMETSTET